MIALNLKKPKTTQKPPRILYEKKSRKSNNFHYRARMRGASAVDFQQATDDCYKNFRGFWGNYY